MLAISEEEVRQLLTMEECLEVLEELFREAAQGGTVNASRYRIPLPKGRHHVMAGMSHALGATGLKSYVSVGGGTRMVVVLFDIESGEALALLGAHVLGQLRTGAASGVATKYMARPDAATVGIIGSGYQARTQLEAVCAVRTIRQVWAYSRTPEHRIEFAREMTAMLGVPVEAVATAEAAVAEADIVVTITTSREPVFQGEALRPGTHINAAGSNSDQRRELDETAVRRSDLIVVDDLPQARIEAGELIWAHEQGAFQWEDAVELAQVVSGAVQGRPNANAITLFESQGIGIEDVAAGMHVYRKAVERGMGRTLEL